MIFHPVPGRYPGRPIMSSALSAAHGRGTRPSAAGGQPEGREVRHIDQLLEQLVWQSVRNKLLAALLVADPVRQLLGTRMLSLGDDISAR